MARSLLPGRSAAIPACLKRAFPEFLSWVTCATARSSASPRASAEGLAPVRSCASTWQKSNDAGRQKSLSRMTELLTTPPEQLVEQLRKIAVFSDLPQDDLLWFVSKCQELRLAAGDIVMREGDKPEFMFIMLEGEIRARAEHGPADGPVFTMSGGEVSGMLPFSRLKVISVTGRAVVPSHYLVFHVSYFDEMFHRLPELVRRLVGLLADRVRNVTRQEQQHEKLAALGKLSAGLAHELNNPSAATRRSAAALRDCLARLRGAARSTSIGPKDCALLARRQAELAASPTIMHHKLKRGITVAREYAPHLPRVMANGSELNQVWTNLIDNAADAMKGSGTLTIRTAHENDFVLVEIADNGPGIPPEVKSRIFDPFFTTKGVGEGTGLGLDIVNRIVKNARGSVTVKSVPGDTRFQVRIPIQAAM